MTDEDGFQNKKTINQADIVVISYFYTQVGNISPNQNSARKLEMLSRKTVNNLRVSAYTTPHESIILSEVALKLNSKKIVLQVAQSNDLTACEVYLKRVKQGRPSDNVVREQLKTLALPEVFAKKKCIKMIHYSNLEDCKCD